MNEPIAAAGSVIWLMSGSGVGVGSLHPDGINMKLIEGQLPEVGAPFTSVRQVDEEEHQPQVGRFVQLLQAVCAEHELLKRLSSGTPSCDSRWSCWARSVPMVGDAPKATLKQLHAKTASSNSDTRILTSGAVW